MYHAIVFTENMTLDVEVSAKQPLERLRVRIGTRTYAQLKPYVVETPDGFVEVADLFFHDGTATRAVPFERFSFLD
jgi:hypothetical protein